MGETEEVKRLGDVGAEALIAALDVASEIATDNMEEAADRLQALSLIRDIGSVLLNPDVSHHPAPEQPAN